MQAVLMAGGQGRRLRPLTAVLPKPLIPLGDISVIEMVLRQLRWYGFSRVTLCVGHHAELVMAVVGDGSRYGLDVSYYTEPHPLGTIGSLARLEGLEEHFLVMNGDICTDLDYSELLRWHRGHGAPASIATHRRVESLELGVVHADAEGERVVAFEEKPRREYWAAMGVNAFSRSVVDLIPKDGAFGFDDLMGTLLGAEWEVRTYRHSGFWLDIGRADDYERMLDEFAERAATLLPDRASRSPA